MDGVELVTFKDSVCAYCKCPIRILDLGKDFKYYCHAHTDMLATIVSSEYWQKHHNDWLQQEKNKRRMRPGEDYFPGG